MKLLSESEVAALLDTESVIESSAAAYRAVSGGTAETPLRTEMIREDPHHVVLVMPGFLGDRVFGVKVISSKYVNAAAQTGPLAVAMVLLFEAETLRPLGLVAADRLSDYRTGAGLAVATRALARPDSRTLAVYGAGKLAYPTIRLICAVRPIERLLLVSRTQAKVDRLAEQVRREPDLEHVDVSTDVSADDAAEAADVIATVTTSTAPVFDGSRVRPGTHVNLGGCFLPTGREIDDAVMSRARVYADNLAACLERAGDLVLPMQSGALDKDRICGEIGAVLEGSLDGRRSRDEITVFKSLGTAAQDLDLGATLVDLAERQGRGVDFDPS